MAELDDLSITDASNTARFPENMQFRNVNDGARALEGMLAREYRDRNMSLAASGSSNAFSVTPNRALTGLSDGLLIGFTANQSITGAATINVGGLGIRPIVSSNGSALVAGDIVSGQKLQIVYRAASNDWQIVGQRTTGSNADITARVTPVGTIIPYGGSTLPAGYLWAAGGTASRTAYAELFAVYGTTYGAGDGSTTFGLPDWRGRTPFGKDDMGGTAANRLTSTFGIDGATLGATGGAQSTTLITANLPAHNHTATVTDPGHAHAQTVTSDGGFTGPATGGGTTAYAFDGAQNTASATTGISVSIGNTGSGSAFSNIPPGAVSNWIILAIPAAASASTLGVNGHLYRWSTTTTDTDPGSGKLGFDNATLSSATTLFISETDAASGPMANVLALWDDSTSTTKGTLYVYKVGQLSTYCVFTVSGTITDAGAYAKFTVAHAASNGTFAADDQLSVLFVAKGDKGDTGLGTAGPAGPNTGLEYAWDTGTTDANPGSGNFRVNNATLGSATFAYISKTDRLSNSQGTNIDQWDASTNTHLGTLRVFDVATRTKGFTAEVTTAFTDGTTYWKIPLASIQVLSGGAPASTDVLTVVWSRTGNKGADGAGSGDVTGQASSVDNEIALFSGTGGKTIKRATTTGVLKATSGVIAAAVSGTDYAPATSGTSVLKGNGSGGFSAAVAGTDYASLSFTTIAVSGQSNVVADSAGDTLTLAAGSNITITTNAATDTVTIAASGGGGSGSPSIPQGRLTLTTGTPVMTSNATAQTTVYYTPYSGRFVPIYNGTTWTMTDIGGELSQTTTDTTKSPSAVTTNSNYDLFVWNDGGTFRCTRGPAWTSDTARGTGAGTTELTRVAGLLVNANAITNGPAAQRGTYVGTIRTNGSSQVDYSFGGTATGGTAAIFGVWNMYNRVTVSAEVRDDTDSWSYSTTSFRAANASNSMRASFVAGLNEDGISATYSGASANSGSNAMQISIGYDSTSSPSGTYQLWNSSSIGPSASDLRRLPGLGFHYVQAIERGNTSATFYGDNGAGTVVSTGLSFAWRC